MLRIRQWIVVLIFALQPLLGVQPLLAQDNPRAVSKSADPRDRMSLTLLGEANGPQSVHLTLTASPLLNAPSIAVRWEVGSAQLQGGALQETLAALGANQSVQLARDLVLPGEGIFPISVLVTYNPYTGAQYGASAIVFALVDANGNITLSERDPNAVSPMHSTMHEVAGEADANAAGVADSCVTVSGRITRIDRVNTAGGRQAPVMVPVRNALVEIREEDLVFDDSYQKQLTNSNGDYSMHFCDDDGVFDDDLEVYIRLRAELRVGDFTVVEVEDSSWIDEVYEYDSDIIETDGGNFTRDFALDEGQSGVFNIADAILDGWNFWNTSGGATGDDATFDYSAEVHWEPGYGDSISHYNGYVFDEITIADSPDPDQWDDSVIIHEWGHQADDNYGCDDNPGGKHNFGTVLNDPELAWGEGYPDYWQSAVRIVTDPPNGRFYIDADGNGNNRITLDMENIGGPADPAVEDSVAGMLWDLADSVNDGQDQTGFGHATLQQVYTDPKFEANGDVFDDTCTANVYLTAWRDLGKATDAATAASVTQNVGLANPFSSMASAGSSVESASEDVAQAAVMAKPQQLDEVNVPGGTPEDYIWWQKVTMVADNSASMAGSKFNAVKTVMEEQVNDLQGMPKGVEFALYNFNNVQAGSPELVRGRFYPDFILPSIQAMTTRGEADGSCPVNAFGALSSAIQDKRNGEAWVYTDGDTILGPGVENMQQLLTMRGLHGSFVLLGGCGSPPDTPPNTSGAMYNFLGKAANATQSSGIVPYLLTAIGSGGQFLFVNESQLADAGDILRAQLSHSAGAGKWSDYVSTTSTYSWDKLTSWEYEWIEPDPEDSKGQATGNTNPLEVTLPTTVTVYGIPYTTARIYGDGFVRMGSGSGGPILVGSRTLNILHAPLFWETILTSAANTADAPASADTPEAINAYYQDMSVDEQGEWTILTTQSTGGSVDRAYQALLNKNTDEIRFQYQAVSSADAGNAVIGVENFVPIGTGNEVVVSNMQVNGANPGTGYKFTPMPPQPTKTFTVPVDGLMSGVGFLLTGYSGSLAPLVVTDPDGTAVNCADTDDVLCLDLGLVQYVQVDVNGRNGDWHAVVSPGASGQGTFSFSAMGASIIKAESPFDHQLAAGLASSLKVKLGAVAASNQLTAWLQRPDGSRLGSEFILFDDGTHGDDGAGDGLFGLADFVPPGVGVAYLWLRGTVNGVDLQRSDPAPYNFQPLSVVGPQKVAYYGSGVVDINYSITNLGDIRYCYDLPVQLPPGWSAQWQLTLSEALDGFCLDPNQTEIRALRVTPTSLQDPAPSGTSAELVVTFSEEERGQIVDSAVTGLTRYNPAAFIAIENHGTSSYLRPNNSDIQPLTVGVFDSQGFAVEDGTVVNMIATLGTVTPTLGATVKGQLPVTFTAGTTVGDALVTASVGLLITDTVIHILEALPNSIEFQVTPIDMRNDTTADLVATVLDQWGSPVEGQTVRIGVENDAQSGVVTAAAVGAALEAPAEITQASDVVTLTTDALGQVAAVFTKADGAKGIVGVRADLLFDDGDGNGPHVALEERKEIFLDASAFFDEIYLPTIRRQQ